MRVLSTPLLVTQIRWILLIIAFVATPRAFGGLSFPSYLTKSDREVTLAILGFGTSSKILASPYPLGGYSGLELGVSTESISTKEIGELSTGSDMPSTFLFPKFSIGKGLFNDLDIFFHFVPLTELTSFSEYGLDLRWVFFQAKFFPTTLGLRVHANSANISNILITESHGFDLIAGVNLSTFSIYLGIGSAIALGYFANSGTPLPLNDSGSDEYESITSFHSVIGSSIQLGSLVLAGQIDHYVNPIYSVKVGFRF